MIPGRTALVLAGALLWTSAASAQVPGEEIARRAFAEGVALEKKGDFAAALEKFTSSEQIKPTLGNRYHKAYCLEMTGKLAAAMIEYEGVERGAREARKADLVEAARLRLEPLRARVPRLSLQLAAGSPSDAEVLLDGTAVSPALLDGESFRIDPGEHVVSARAPSHEPFEERFAAAEGSSSSVAILLTKVAAAPPPERPAARRDEAAAPSRALPIVTTAGAILLAGAGVGAFVAAGGEQDDGERGACATPTCEDERSAVRTFDAIALGSFIGAAGLGALSIVLWTSSPRAEARVAVRPSWAGVEGRFW